MYIVKKRIGLILLGVGIIVICVLMFPRTAKAEPIDNTNYTIDATATEAELSANPGVYTATVQDGANKETDTIGIPSVAKENLVNNPTTESPAIITGAAANYETKTGPTEFTPIPGAELVAPYSYFRWSIIDEQIQNEDGTISVHKKVSGFDGTYYIIRLDMTDFIQDQDQSATSDLYLHVEQEGNTALMVAIGMNADNTTFVGSQTINNTPVITKTGSYSLANNAIALKDSETGKPFIDIILLASGKIVAGADGGTQGAPSADYTVSFYVDNVKDYDPSLVYDPMSTDPNHQANCLAKFFRDANYTSSTKKTSYTVKGSDLEIDVMIDDRDVTGEKPQFWSLTNAMTYQPYDSHTIKLISEVPVLNGITLESTTGNMRNVILDVNSFDIQIANNTITNTAGLVVGNNAILTLTDSTSTAGAELAIGNNANMVIKNGGTLIIDPSCVLEVEYDAASVMSGQIQPTLSNGEIVVEGGGTLINNGVVNVEGTEGKPIDPVAPSTRDIRPATMIVQPNGAFINNGTLSVKGRMYVLGNLTNNGRYNDLISKTDPDKGSVDYHKGIQITWKDDVTQPGVVPGAIYVGCDANGNVYPNATLTNNGDIVIAPGSIELYGTLDTRTGHVYLADVNEAVIPITPTAEAPLIVEKRVVLDKMYYGLLNVKNGANILGGEENFSNAFIHWIHNGVMGDLTSTGEAILYPEIIRATDIVLYANDGVRDLVQGVDFILHDGWIEFTDEYLSSFMGKRTVRINIGYRFLYEDVVGTKVENIKPTQKLTAPKTEDTAPIVMLITLIIMVLGLGVIGVKLTRR